MYSHKKVNTLANERFVSLSTVSLRLVKQPEHRPKFEKKLTERLREILEVPKTVAITTMPDSPLWWQRAKTIAETMETERKFEKEHPECAKSPTGKHEWRFGKCMWCGTEATEVTETSSEGKKERTLAQKRVDYARFLASKECMGIPAGEARNKCLSEAFKRHYERLLKEAEEKEEVEEETEETVKIEKIEGGLWIIVKGHPPAELDPEKIKVPAFAYKEESARHIAKGLAPCYIYQLKYSVTKGRS